MEIIDAHNHVGGLASWGAGNGAADADSLDAEIEARLRILDERGVRKAVVIAGHDYLRPDGLADNRRVNDHLAAYRAARPDRFPAGVGIVEPLHGERGLDELDRCKQELGFAGISFHTRMQGVSIDSPWVRRYLEHMGEIGLVPFIHSIGESSAEALWKIDVLAGDLPDLPMLVLDVLSTFEQSLFVLHVAERRPNLTFDTALAHGVGFVRMLIDRCGASRVVYGSDLYCSKTGEHLELSDVLDGIVGSGLADGEKAAILHGNITSLLELPA
jgi:predicted TIM-barrel fold metal-dependent hydrolase